jgi:LacI family transcriptional regulator
MFRGIKDLRPRNPDRLFSMTVTIKDIARALDISPATVSRALKNDSRITVDVRERVTSMARKLGYRPNLLARGLVSNRTHAIGYIVDNLSWSFFSELAERVQITAEEFAYSTYIYSCLKSPQKEREGIDGFLSRGVDGLLVSATESPENMRIYRELSQANFPIVLFNDLPDVEVDSVVTDNYEGATKAMRHLYEHGHREIMFIGPKENTTFKTQRLAGYRDFLGRNGLSIREDLVHCEEDDPMYGYRVVKAVMGAPRKPTAVFVHNDTLAMGVYRAVHEMGLRIPDDLSVVGYDNLDSCQFMYPPLTTVEFPIRHLARAGVELLMKRMSEKKLRSPEQESPRIHQKISLTPRLIIRQSTGPLRVTSDITLGQGKGE